MSDIFGRVFSIDLDSKPFIEVTEDRQFRVSFEVMIDPNGSNCTADIAIYNLSSDTSMEAFRQGQKLTLRAGYADAVDTIFKGQVVNVLRERVGPDTRTRLLCRSGATSEVRNTITRTFGAGSRIEDIIKALGVALGFDVVINPEDFKDSRPFVRGYPINGDAQTYLSKLGGEYQFTWVIEHDRIVIMKTGKIRTGPIHVISQFTGMEGIPEITGGVNAVGADVVIRLNPKVRINGRFKIESQYATFNTGNLYFTEIPKSVGEGTYNIIRIQHSGDNYSSTWSTLIKGVRDAEELKQEAPKPKIQPMNGDLAWGQNVQPDFRIKIKAIASGLSTNPDWLMSVMAFETRESFNPAVKNPYGSATGLIQFIEKTAETLGTTTAALAKMTAVRQLDYVQQYYSRYSGRINNLGDAYMAVLWPVAVGKPDSYVLWNSTTVRRKEYIANKGLDKGNKGYITKGDAVAEVAKKLEKGLTRKA